MARAKRPVSVNGIEFDALMSQSQTLSSTVPSYAVEDGYEVSDSIILGSESISMTLFITNTPVTWQKRHSSDMTRVESIEKRLKQLYFSREPVTVITTDETYTNMAIESISFSKATETAYAREIPITFKKIQLSTAQTTIIPASYGKSGATGASAGTANTSTGTGTGNGSSNSSNNGNKSSILYSVGKSIGIV